MEHGADSHPMVLIAHCVVTQLSFAQHLGCLYLKVHLLTHQLGNSPENLEAGVQVASLPGHPSPDPKLAWESAEVGSVASS